MKEDLSKYYDSILEKAEELIKVNKYEKAMELLQDELDAPYMPLDYVSKFEEKLLDTEYNFNYNNPKNTYQNLSKMELINIVLQNKENAEMALINLFDNFHDEFDEIDFAFFKKILLDKNIDNNIKVMAMNLMQINQVDLIVDFYNKNLNKVFTINISEFKSIEQIDFFTEVRDCIYEQAAKEPWMLDFCYASLYLFYVYYYPDISDINETAAEFTFALMNVIKMTIEGHEPTNELEKKILVAIKNNH